MKLTQSTLRGAASGLALILMSTVPGHGAGFALQEHGISGLGVGYASGAAGGEDNSSMFFNPATLVLTGGPELTTGIHFILPEADFRNEGSITGFIPGVSPGVPTQGGNSSSEEAAIVPNLFYSHPLSEDFVLGIGISTPYGLATSYEKGWVGRYVALETDLATVNVNLAMGYRLSDTVSIGFGVSALHGDAILSNAVNFGLVFLNGLQTGLVPATPEALALSQDVQANLGGTKYDGELYLEGDDFGFGFNFGILFTPNESTRIGLHYRSKVKLALEGNADFTVGALESVFGALFVDQGGSVDIELPDTAQLSIHHRIDDKWAIMGDIFHTWWSKFDTLEIRYATGFPSNTVIPENWEDVWRYSIGATYELNESVQLRGGLVYDESAVPSDLYRSPRIPDEDRVWLSFGIGYRMSDNLSLDFAFTHIMVEDPVIDNPTHTSGEFLKGTIEATVNMISIGGTYRF
jgi:long-chain fatty acid transport protein